MQVRGVDTFLKIQKKTKRRNNNNINKKNIEKRGVQYVRQFR